MALSGFTKYLLKVGNEKMEHAKKLMRFQNERGGRIVLQDIKKPAKDGWGAGKEMMKAALEVERAVNRSLLDLHKIANAHNDPQVHNYT